MYNKRQWQKAFLSTFVIWTILINGLPVEAQDIVTSDDLSGGSSVFVFKQRKAPQIKVGFRGNSLKSTTAQRTDSRRRVREQVNTVAKVQRTRAPKVDPNTVAVNIGTKTGPKTGPKAGGKTGVGQPGANTATPDKASIALAGAAETYLDQDKYDQAIEYFKTAIELSPKNVNAKLGLSEAYTRKADDVFEKAGADASTPIYEQAIQYNDQNSAAYAGLGAAYDAGSFNDKAIFNYEKALALNKNLTQLYAPLGVLYYQKSEIAKADDSLTKALALDTNNPDVNFYVGMIRYKQNRSDEAIAAIKKTLASNPNSAEAHYYLGESYDQANRSSEALSEYNQAIKINPDYTDAWFDLAVANYNQGNYQQAVDSYKQVIRLKSDYGQAYANLADVYRQMAMDYKDPGPQKRQLYELANSQYSVAATFIKNDPDLYSNWGFCLGRVSKWEPAINQLNTAVSLNTAANNGTAIDYQNIGWAYYNWGRKDLEAKNDAAAKPKLEKGKEALQKAVAQNPQLFPALHNLGITFNDLGDFQNAVKALKAAVDLRPKFLPSNVELGFAYNQLKDFDNAVKYLKNATSIDDKSVFAWYYLGLSEKQRGNLAGAKEAQQRLKDLKANYYANDIERTVLGSGLLNNPKNNIENKVNEKNPLNKLPKLPF